jgi:hypothetical protein
MILSIWFGALCSSQWGGKDPQLLVSGLVSSSYLSVASRDVAGEQHNTNKSDVTVITAAHDGSAPTPLEFSPNKPFRLPELSSVQAQYMYLSSFTIIKTLLALLLLNLAACCGVFESASGLERPRLWNIRILL